MISDDAVRGVNAVRISGTKVTGVGTSGGNILDGGEQRSEDVSVVVGASVLKDGDETFETEAGVDVFVGKRSQAAVGLAIILDKDVVPDLKNVRIILIDEMGGIAAADPVVVNLGAGTARTLVAHLPEVVLHIAGQDMIFSNTDGKPEVARF